ncbi:S41 family peptidase [Mucilaginibacter sp. HD30]
MKKNAAIIFRSAILILLGLTIGLYINGDNFIGHDTNFSSSGPSKLSKVLDLVRNKYVDSVNVDSVEGETVNELLQRLDPHSLYLPAQQALSVNEKLEGGFNGVGIEYSLLRDTLVISYVYPDGPAALQGIKAGDKVVEVDNEKFSGTNLTNELVNKKLRGTKGSDLLMGILRANTKEIKAVNVKRDRVTLSSIDAAYKVDAETGYIKISKFATNTDADFRAELLKLKEDGVKKLVLDLRGNGGGYLNSATSLADEFLNSKQLIVYTKGIHEPRTDYFATDSGTFQDGKLAVLIDEYSASASEILAGALQDLDRATIVGRRSFGKGLVQEQFQFDDGSAVNLTVARYYTASGRSIQKTYKNGVASYRNELAERMRKGELFSAESNLNDSVMHTNSKYRTSTGRKVFSGGGIMPDVFVPEDTTKNTWLISQLTKNDLFTAYTIDYLQSVLKLYNADDDFVNGYNVSDAAMAQFIKYASLIVKDITKEEIAASKAHLKTLLKANAAHFKWGDAGYYKALNSTDIALKKAVESLN